jgi:hypothetical protein
MESTLMAHVDTQLITREQLAVMPTPPGTATHRPIPHHEVVDALVETLGFRHIGVHNMEFAVSDDGNKCFGLIEMEHGFTGARFALGLRNSHDKTMRLALTVGYRVFVCDNMAFHGDFQPVLAKHTKNFNLNRALSGGIDDMQRNFKPMVEAVDRWKDSQLSDVAAKLIIYRAFVEAELEVPRHLDRKVHEMYFDPQHDEFRPRTMWSLSNAFTSAFKDLDPIPQYRATGRLAGFLETTGVAST